MRPIKNDTTCDCMHVIQLSMSSKLEDNCSVALVTVARKQGRSKSRVCCDYASKDGERTRGVVEQP